MNKAEITVVIVHWQTPDLLLKQIKTLQESELVAKIVVVDNHTLPNKFKLPSAVKLISLPHNYGYSFACNVGLMEAQTNWVCFLNPDATPTTQALNSWLKQTEDNHLTASSPRPSSQSYNKPIPSFFSLVVEFSPLNKIVPLKLISPKTLTGGALLIKTQSLKQMGGWDERFFLWFEDSDLTKQLQNSQEKFGFVEADLVHLGGKSFSKISADWQKNVFFNHLLIYARKYFSGWQIFFLTLLTKRFNSQPTLPIDSELTHQISVPNLNLKLATKWLASQYSKLDHAHTELVLITTCSSKDYWKLKQLYPHLRIINQSVNKGFAQTVNLGLAISRAKWNCTINDDAFIQHGSWQDLTAKLPAKTGSVNPIIKNIHHEIESAGIEVLKIGKAKLTKNLPNKLTKTTATNGAAVCYNQSALAKTGFFDAKFGSYLEDIDLSLRLSKKGFNNFVNPAMGVLHLQHQTSKTWSTKKHWLDFKNWWLLTLKNWRFQDYAAGNLGFVLERGRNLSAVIKSIAKV